MNYCIPYNHIIDDNIKNDNQDFIPKVIDYSCGAGHFLTEAMDRIQNYIDTIDKTKQGNKIKSQLNIWQKDEDGVVLKWADRFIFGIEKDYRLAKTTKIACFMNGDGEANILPADGLASFDCQEYKSKIQAESFDVIVANPPFSVDDFKLAEGNNYKKDFPELYNRLGENSDDIECLFIERTKQLLKEGGCCAVILPSSILESGGIFTATRKMFLKYFDLVGIQELKSKNVFMATNTETIILFAKKHDKTKEYKEIEKFVKDKFIQSQQDFSYHNNENVIEKFCKKADKTKAELLEILNNKKTQNDTLEKLVIFISNYNKKCIISTFDGNSEKCKIGKQFLGFEHSERKKYEGIRPNNEDGVIRSQLYTDENVFDDKKVNYYFYNAFLGEFLEVHDNLKGNVSYKTLDNIVVFDRTEKDNKFECVINTNIRPRQEIENGVELKELCEFIGKGKRPASFENQSGNIDFIVSSFEKKKCLKADFNGEYLVIGDGGKANMHYLNGEFSASDHTYILRQKSQNVLLKYIYVYLMCNLHVINNGFTGLGIKNVSKSFLEKIQIQLTPLSTQQEIIDKFDEIEWKQNENKKKITSNNNKIFEVIEDVVERKEPIIFTEFVKTIQPSIKLQKQEWLSKGNYPIISQETNNLISGYTNNEEAVIKEKPIIAFSNHTLSIKCIDFDFCYGADGMQLLKVDNTKIDTKLFSYILKNRLKEIDDKKYSRHFSKVKMLKFLLPSLETQH